MVSISVIEPAGSWPSVPITSGWPAWPISRISRPRRKWISASRCTFVTSGQVASIAMMCWPRLLLHGARHAVGGEHHRRVAVGDFAQLLDEDRALGLEALDHVAVVDDLVADVDRRPVKRERPLDGVDGAHDAGAEAARRAQDDFQGRFGVRRKSAHGLLGQRNHGASMIGPPIAPDAARTWPSGRAVSRKVTFYWTAPTASAYIRDEFQSSLMTTGFALGAGEAQEEICHDTQPLMPKATAVWLVENTALSFDQIADFCKLHVLEVKAIADGDAAQGIKGLDPITTGQLTREQIDNAEANPEVHLHIADPEGAAAAAEDQARPALHARVAPAGPPERHPLADPQPSGAQGQRDHAARRHHQDHDRGDPRAAATGTPPTCSRWTR